MHFDLVGAGLTIHCRRNPQAVGIAAVKFAVAQHLFFSGRAAIPMIQPQFKFCAQRAQHGGGLLGFLQVGMVHRRVKVVGHNGLQQRLAKAVALADKAAQHIRHAILFRQNDVAAFVAVVQGAQGRSCGFRKLIQWEFIAGCGAGQLLELLVEAHFLIFDLTPCQPGADRLYLIIGG